MNIISIGVGFTLLLSTSIANACSSCWWDSSQSAKDWHQGMPSMRRHHYVMKNGLPDDYRGLTNPLRPDDSIMTEGMQVYAQSCASCHGDSGRGDGPASDAIEPRPANLRHLGRMSMMTNDAYLYWTIAEGGKSVGSDMPRFKDALSDKQIWRVIYYVRNAL